MIIDKEGSTTIITQERSTLIELVKKLEALYPKYKNDNIIVSLSIIEKIAVEQIIEFLRLSNMHRKAKQSFVIVTDKIGVDEIPDELVVVPTIQEAHDIIEMEEMERDLGF